MPGFGIGGSFPQVSHHKRKIEHPATTTTTLPPPRSAVSFLFSTFMTPLQKKSSADTAAATRSFADHCDEQDTRKRRSSKSHEPALDTTVFRPEPKKSKRTSLEMKQNGTQSNNQNTKAKKMVSTKRSRTTTCLGCSSRNCSECQQRPYDIVALYSAARRPNEDYHGYPENECTNRPSRRAASVKTTPFPTAPRIEDMKPAAAKRKKSNGSGKFGSLVQQQQQQPPQKSSLHASDRMDRTTENQSVEQDTEIFTLTSYLDEFSSNFSRYYNERNSSASIDVKRTDPATTLYGLDIPNEAPLNVCSGCLGAREDEFDDHPILLCDGPNCGREYHLACCVPALSFVPDVDVWLCRDCCPDGSTSSLVEYLEGADDSKHSFLRVMDSPSPGDYVEYLTKYDSLIALTEANRIPQSELERSTMTHSLALCDQKHLSRTRAASERREALPSIAYLGKPIRLYNPLGNIYHTGRIVQFRTQGKKKETEFLIRFTNGKDDRKKAYHRWIVLEEHSVAVGMTLVWAKMPAAKWTPSMLWLRTSRELIPVQQELKESEGEIIYSTTSPAQWGSPSKTKHKVCALARSFGDEVFCTVNVRDQCVDLNDPEATNLYLKDPENIIEFHMAQAEQAEQERVRSWSGLEQFDPMGPLVLSSVDCYTLPPLVPYKTVPLDGPCIPKLHAALCPNVSFGLDRAEITKLLQRRGIQPSRDIASSLVCELIPVNARTMEEERLGRTSHQ